MRFFFKWIDSQDSIPLNEIKESDLDILDLTLTQREGEIALCTLTIPLNSILKKENYALLVVENEGKRTVLFLGKLIDLPIQVNDLHQKIELFALPRDYLSQLNALKENVQKSEDWDELFIEEGKQDDPAEILEARTELFCWHPVTHKIVLSNFFEGREKRVFNESQILQDSLKIKIAELPKPYINLTVVAEWVQEAEGEINILPRIEKKFQNGKINTLTPKGLLLQWPRKGQVLGRSGYAIVDSSLYPVNPSSTGMLNLYPKFTDHIELEEESREPLRLKKTWLSGKLKIGWFYKQKRREIVKLKLNHRHPFLSRRESKKLDLTLRLSDLSKHLPSAAIPSFFETERGKKAIQHALKIAACHLAPSARSHEISIKVPISEALRLTLDDSIIIRHPSLLAGETVGKLISYKIYASFEKAWAQLNIAIVPNGETSSRISRFELIAESELEGLPFPEEIVESSFIDSLNVKNDALIQEELIKIRAPKNRDELKQILQENQTEIAFTLKDIRSKDVMERYFSVNTPLYWSALATFNQGEERK